MAWAAAIQAVGSIVQGIGEMQTQRQNAANATAEGKQAVVTGEAEARRVRAQVAAQQGELRAGAGAQGTTFTGSPMEVYLENAKQGEIMAQDRSYQGQLIKRTKKMEANLYIRKATGAMVGGLFGAAGAAASGASK